MERGFTPAPVVRIRNYKSKLARGFTLLELLLAAAIFAFTMAGILLLFINCAFLDKANRNKSIATIHAETAMENIRSQSFGTIQTNLCLDGAPITWSLDPQDDLGITDPLTSEGIDVITTLECCSSDPLDWLDITVNVSWLDKGQRSRSLALGTSISR